MSRPQRFADRSQAGRELAGLLSLYAHRDDVVVLALPRGGIPVAVPVAQALEAPLDMVMVRKLGLPAQPEVAMGAIANGGGTVVQVHNRDIVDHTHTDQNTIDEVFAMEAQELKRREHAYRGDRPTVSLTGTTVVMVDDGLATGATMRAAIAAVRREEPARVVVAVPVASPEAAEAVAAEADEFQAVATPRGFGAVAQFYDNFAAVEDAEVIEALRNVGG